MTDKTIPEIEHALGTALAEDIEATIGEPVTVLSHVCVAHVMLENGMTRTTWTASEGLDDYALLGLSDWIYQEVRQKR